MELLAGDNLKFFGLGVTLVLTVSYLHWKALILVLDHRYRAFDVLFITLAAFILISFLAASIIMNDRITFVYLPLGLLPFGVVLLMRPSLARLQENFAVVISTSVLFTGSMILVQLLRSVLQGWTQDFQTLYAATFVFSIGYIVFLFIYRWQKWPIILEILLFFYTLIFSFLVFFSSVLPERAKWLELGIMWIVYLVIFWYIWRQRNHIKQVTRTGVRRLFPR